MSDAIGRGEREDAVEEEPRRAADRGFGHRPTPSGCTTDAEAIGTGSIVRHTLTSQVEGVVPHRVAEIDLYPRVQANVSRCSPIGEHIHTKVTSIVRSYPIGDKSLLRDKCRVEHTGVRKCLTELLHGFGGSLAETLAVLPSTICDEGTDPQEVQLPRIIDEIFYAIVCQAIEVRLHEDLSIASQERLYGASVVAR